ncbi:MAG: hypothetical protein ACI3YA_03055, partial [Alloprevotella sp.]
EQCGYAQADVTCAGYGYLEVGEGSHNSYCLVTDFIKGKLKRCHKSANIGHITKSNFAASIILNRMAHTEQRTAKKN